jgi:hypothetical protein
VLTLVSDQWTPEFDAAITTLQACMTQRQQPRSRRPRGVGGPQELGDGGEQD